MDKVYISTSMLRKYVPFISSPGHPLLILSVYGFLFWGSLIIFTLIATMPRKFFLRRMALNRTPVIVIILLHELSCLVLQNHDSWQELYEIIGSEIQNAKRFTLVLCIIMSIYFLIQTFKSKMKAEDHVINILILAMFLAFVSLSHAENKIHWTDFSTINGLEVPTWILSELPNISQNSRVFLKHFAEGSFAYVIFIILIYTLQFIYKTIYSIYKICGYPIFGEKGDTLIGYQDEFTDAFWDSDSWKKKSNNFLTPLKKKIFNEEKIDLNEIKTPAVSSESEIKLPNERFDEKKQLVDNTKKESFDSPEVNAKEDEQVKDSQENFKFLQFII